MVNLNDLEGLRKLDPKNTLDSTDLIADQCFQAWKAAKAVTLPKEYASAENIVIAGMGGSAYAGSITQTLFKDSLKVPFVINSDYELPAFVNEKTLVIVTSYSGNTEESLLNLQTALKKKAKVLGLASGGALIKACQEQNVPYVAFDPVLNYAKQPRLGVGYLVFSTLSILAELKYLSLTDKDVQTAADEMKQNLELVKQDAKKLAESIYDKAVIIFAADFLIGTGSLLRNLFNETAKNFAAFFPFPDLNHHLMEGLQNPKDKKVVALFITSPYYSPAIKKRVELTKDVVAKNNVTPLEYEARGSDKLAQVLSVLSIAAYTSLYLGFLYKLDPSRTPWVDYFKEKLAS